MDRGIPRIVVCVVVLALLHLCSGVQAVPTTPHQAERIVRAWLGEDSSPLDTALGRTIEDVRSFTDSDGNAAYYIVNLQGGGFVVVSAEDLVEPIVAFVSDGRYDPSQNNPLGALVSHDVPARVKLVRGFTRQKLESAPTPKSPPAPQEEQSASESELQNACDKAKGKWARLMNASERSDSAPLSRQSEVAGAPAPLAASRISDVRVSALLRTKWSQTDVCGRLTYNLYTPKNFPCGCVATAMAQIMKYHEHPTTPVGTGCSNVWVESDRVRQCIKGGDGRGGAYPWELMDLTPDCGTDPQEREAIGALCYDAGIAARMGYYEGGSSSDLEKAKTALIQTFHYRNAIYGGNDGQNIGRGLINMINPSLDAGYPTMFGIFGGNAQGHAVVCDGYGYDSSTLYHHINIGYGGYADAWYNLPDILDFDTIVACLYNVFPSNTGEIISGRITDESGAVLADVTVTAERDSGEMVSAVTNSRGIYALMRIRSNSMYTVSPNKKSYRFTPRQVMTRRSQDFAGDAGNRWQVDFTGTPGSDADFNKDGVVNFQDLAIFFEYSSK